MRGGTVWSRADCSKIVYHLLDKGRATAPELAEKFEVSVRTIYRDLDVISAAGIPIYTVQGKGGGIFILPEFVLVEIAADRRRKKEQILMALQGLAAAEDSRTDELLTKLGGLFRGQGANWIEVDFSDWHKNTAGAELFDELKRAVFSCRRVSFSYFAGEGGGTVRTGGTGQADFQEQGLVFVRLLPFAKRLPLFKLTRIKDLTLLPETFLRRKADVPELKPTIQQERLISVRLKFSPAAAFRVYDEFTDTVEKDAQGSLYVTVDMPERTLYSYILSYGDAVEILEPDEMRRSMKEKLTRMAEKYKT